MTQSEDFPKVLRPKGKVLPESHYNKLADEVSEDWDLTAEALADFDKNIPEFEGLLRCRQQALTYSQQDSLSNG